VRSTSYVLIDSHRHRRPTSALASVLPPFVNLWSTFGVLTCVHLIASHRALRLLQLSTLNAQRLVMIARAYASAIGTTARLLVSRDI
jgi:hypothetical protein